MKIETKMLTILDKNPDGTTSNRLVPVVYFKTELNRIGEDKRKIYVITSVQYFSTKRSRHLSYKYTVHNKDKWEEEIEIIRHPSKESFCISEHFTLA